MARPSLRPAPAENPFPLLALVLACAVSALVGGAAAVAETGRATSPLAVASDTPPSH